MDDNRYHEEVEMRFDVYREMDEAQRAALAQAMHEITGLNPSECVQALKTMHLTLSYNAMERRARDEILRRMGTLV